jgi:transposase
MRETSTSPTFVAIDVAKHGLDVFARPNNEHRVVAHDDEAVVALTRRLVERRPALVCLEATGGLREERVEADRRPAAN